MTRQQLRDYIEELQIEGMALQKKKREVETKLMRAENELKFKDIPECEHDYYAIRSGKCEHSMIIHGNIYCENPNCKN